MDIDKFISKVLSYKTYSDRRKIDTLLRELADMWTNVGIDSTKQEVKEVKRKSKIIYKAIKQIDAKFGATLIRTADA